ncbi:hypothetical protein LZ30DRAFT_598266 [Colletotrichum cereale]|nr:hypothetical protein LZ30DRAFT_598266 [Colletotrichum cereale]
MRCLLLAKRGWKCPRRNRAHTRTRRQHQARHQPINSVDRCSYWDDVEAEVPCTTVLAHIVGSEIRDQGHSSGP